MKTCKICQNPVTRTLYCSAECRSVGVRLIVAARREVGIRRRFTKDGYIVLYLPENPMANSSGEVAEHRYVMSLHLGRPITRGEEVHHKNHDTTDNRVENLEVLTKDQHFEVHKKERFKVKRASWVVDRMKEGQDRWTEESKPRPCKFCGVVFKPLRPHHKSCSIQCRQAHRDRKNVGINKSCLSCQKAFTTSDTRKTTCSYECSQKRHNVNRLKPKTETACKDCGAMTTNKVFCDNKCYKHYHNTVSRKLWRQSKK